MRQERELDIECYRNYFLVKFRDMKTGRMDSFAMWPGATLNVLSIMDFIWSYTLVTFNGLNYDIPMLMLALTGASTYDLKTASDSIIRGGVKPWQFTRAYGLQPPEQLDHYDIREVAPGVGLSLKLYAGRQHSRKMQDLPIEPEQDISPIERVMLDTYCGNDLIVTGELKEAIRERITLRETISKEYGVDVRSKSDAQIAEAVIKARLGFVPERRYVPDGYSFNYQPPAYIRFQTPQLQAALQTVCAAPIVVRDAEQIQDNSEDIRTGVKLPSEIKALKIRIGQATYQMGIGGLHSQESSVFHYTLPGVCSISDHDVASYYPSLIINSGMYPQQLGSDFLAIYKAIYDRRLFCKAEAKRLTKLLKEPLNADLVPNLKAAIKSFKTEADSLKIVLNGTFGKLGSKYSILFAPEQMIQVTITGQLCLLMLIERLELAGITVISANTDGIVIKVPAGMEAARDAIIAQWERDTRLETEATFYRAVYSRDVNNYIAIKMDGSHKAKGVYGESGISPEQSPSGKHPTQDICADAVIAYLKEGTPIEQTVRTCTDIRRFLVIRAVKGGGWFRQGAYTTHYLGKAVRWYYGKDATAFISNKEGSRVAGSEGCMPLMQLPDAMPHDVNYDHYITEAHRMLRDFGVRVHYAN